MTTRTRRISLLATAALLPLGVLAATGASAATPAASGTTIAVSTSAELTSALASVKAGDTISLAGGVTYSGAFDATTSGTSSAPITLTGPSSAILTNSDSSGDLGTGYGFHLEAGYWNLTGFSVDDSAKGVVLDGADHDVLDGLTVHDIGDEGIHLRAFSSDDVVENSTVHDTGLKDAGYGEGVYIGSAKSNWKTYTDGNPDLSDDDRITGNTFGPNVAAENIDAKEATVGGTISGNTFSGKGESGANSSTDVVAVKGNDYTVSGNTMSDGLVDGFEVEQLVDGSGCGNVFTQNDIDLGASGYGFNVKDQKKCASDPNVVGTSNTVTAAGDGAASIPETSGE
ncbi:right-handed parallel beta-helix repeat-containing protein [Streptomyces sp. SL13]|uniref:Right-handed parallel beta-helix repeat-containing protein n=1 Tax=Streptantibioticus silvisoli TaxID=2705255 RepID=A0AA90H8I5_9ACTN|nr:right-handed parallel beta-helix repeat-containing protein [Streptantibioticus silvisoli]MDI5963784.1 right-handed parallel beta-helix repeat-containing protein [Streptantibioticus silvisoli]MDI5972833.1 right-handed parallel beta-helix repeat-containing protein [Streptantibioticus silvisoli]